MQKFIDLRSDTVPRPVQAMKLAMKDAEVGDDVYGDDPTINRLEQTAAELLQMDASLFVSSGPQSNLLALFSHCQRGDEYIAGQDAHSYLEEGGGGAILASIQPQPIPNELDGTLSIEKINSLIKPDDFHFAQTRLVCLENTWHGKPLPLQYIEKVSQVTQANGLALHLDGARLFNAVVQQKTEVQTISKHFDSVSICLSKGLGAPIGSVLCGSYELIAKARRWRKMLGGGWRHAGVLAAAGIYALTNHIQRLEEDHYHAALLAKYLNQIDGITIENEPNRTNMVWIEMPKHLLNPLKRFLLKKQILISVDDYPLRLVTHLDIDEESVERAGKAFEQFFLTQH